MHMIDHLVRNPPIVLQNVIVLGAHRKRNLLCYWEELGEFSVWNLVKFFGVCFRDHKLYSQFGPI